MFGNQDTEQALENLDSLAAYLEKNPDADIFGPAKSSYIRDMLFILYQDEIMGEDGKINTQTLEKLLLTVEKIAENSGEEGNVSYLAEDSVGLASPFAANEDGAGRNEQCGCSGDHGCRKPVIHDGSLRGDEAEGTGAGDSPEYVPSTGDSGNQQRLRTEGTGRGNL